jgi:hypothetical protein
MNKIEPEIYIITAIVEIDSRPNVEILYFDEDINDVKKVYNELIKENPDIQGLEMMGVDTEYIEYFQDIKLRIMYESE